MAQLRTDSLSDELAIAEVLKKTPIFDVRSPVEFAQGSIPGAVNLPLLSDAERHEVGLCYKQNGQSAAIQLGERLVSGSVRAERLRAWSDFARENPAAILYCFRGGLRSQTVQSWLQDLEIHVPRIAGGYKSVRQTLLRELDAAPEKMRFLTVTGQTGSGKTRFLKEWQNSPSALAAVDLEALANHRGSAFGQELEAQPAVADFENRLAIELLKLRGRAALIEDEGRMIGRLQVPKALFQNLSEAPLIVLQEPLTNRAQVILEDYVIMRAENLKKLNPNEYLDTLAEHLVSPLFKISRKLGGIRSAEALKLLKSALETNRAEHSRGDELTWQEHLPWIAYLLTHYYDPYYDRHIDSQSSRVCFRGSRHELRDYLCTMSFI